MADGHHFLAMDFGAESGRGEVVTLARGRVTMEEVHRFANRPVRLGKTLHWDFLFLFAEILASLRACEQRGVKLSGIGAGGFRDGDAGQVTSMTVGCCEPIALPNCLALALQP